MKYFILFMNFCFGSGLIYSSPQPVDIKVRENYYQVEIDFNTSLTRKQTGKIYGEAILKAVPNYEKLVDSYLKEKIPGQASYYMLIARAKMMKRNLKPEYIEEIEGICQAFSYETLNQLGDGKISADEFLLLSLLPDVARASQCSAISVWGSWTEGGGNLIGRSLDWYSGTKRQLNQIQAVILYRVPGKNNVVSIGYLGFSGILTGINSKKIFAAILDSPTGKENSLYYGNFYSYPLDLRAALEECQNLKDAEEFMRKRKYSFNHLIFMGDGKFSGVVENTVDNKREFRLSESEMDSKVFWKDRHSIAAVNSFLLKSNPKNHFAIPINPLRWEIFSQFIFQKQKKNQKISFQDLKVLFSKTRKGRPDSQSKGELYHYRTQQVIVYEPSSMKLELFFSPVKGQPAKPYFESFPLERFIQIKGDEN